MAVTMELLTELEEVSDLAIESRALSGMSLVDPSASLPGQVNKCSCTLVCPLRLLLGLTGSRGHVAQPYAHGGADGLEVADHLGELVPVSSEREPIYRRSCARDGR
jgi:hypothetical protein